MLSIMNISGIEKSRVDPYQTTPSFVHSSSMDLRKVTASKTRSGATGLGQLLIVTPPAIFSYVLAPGKESLHNKLKLSYPTPVPQGKLGKRHRSG
jgi:hypothetical protein